MSPTEVNFPEGLRSIAVISDYSMTTLGGAETAYFEQVRTLGQHLEVTAMSSGCPRLTELGNQPGVTAIEVPIWFRVPLLGLPVTRHTAELRDFFRRTFIERGIQLMHIHSEFGIAAAAVAAAQELGIPVVHTIHTFFWQTQWPIQRPLGWGTPLYHKFVTGLEPSREVLADEPGNSALRNMTLTVARQVDSIISPSSHQAARLAEAGLGPITVIPNTMAAPIDAAVLERIGRPLRLLWIGRFVPEKRILPFIRAACTALDALPPNALEIDIVGEGEQFSKAQRLAAGHPQINLHGRVQHSRVQDMLAQSHLSVLTSVGWDNQPMVIVESINGLRGVIVCDPALTEGLDGPGIPAFGTDEETLARVMIDLATNTDKVVEASKACLSAREEFSVETYVARTLGVYADALASKA